MRIIGGKLKGIRLQPPANLPVRPTTDMAKEALFNILNNRFDFDTCTVLDLFCGTGNLTFEFASRNAEKILAVDMDYGCVNWVKSAAQKYEFNQVEVRKGDVFKILKQMTGAYDLIFADPPYNMPNIPQLPILVQEQQLLKPDGLLVVEHQSNMKLNSQPGYTETRKYGNSSFSFFEYV
ncbi:16S rRNA (guanine(966)-N(2))-methyltransferase RsmD [Pedobacter psychrotolerans]|uniref:Methyltransferase n=1 Tax=Pedobacter psychrotolerans TaxID=1843235 RepID=A0A4R2HMS3_9SPHI|nr:16S rRNA (guanine(966)-N(2))-methyltransferase RsmD [Pedobacter psychrotolerans]TCO31283.1 16S rRNA (guanine(966)-N(2))-methyltransferase RsmD [Pedobacter psychrotolerans]GGE40851.1 methyltransferase [Pedobacter psychrotolerans]